MSEVRQCEHCNAKEYASEPMAPTQKTIEYDLCERDDLDSDRILSRDWILCIECYRNLVLKGPPTCPYCLEPVMPDQDPRACEQRPEVAG